MDSQEIALRLQKFWREEGCPIIPPYGSIAVGGFTPAMFFGALGPEPWRASQTVTVINSPMAFYDGDPLRPIVDHRIQVAWPDPSGEARGKFVESLRMLGIDPHDRDVRFVARNGRVGNLSCLAECAAYWRVMVDGIEVGSVSPLRRVGGVDLNRVPVIVGYSLGRLAIVAAAYAGKEIPTERDRQMSAYVLNESNAELTGSLISLHADECDGALARGLFFPAYDHVLACLYLLEMHDALGDQNARERTVQSARISDLAKGCASAYLEAANA